ncbi:hypothetical protein [Streptomyces himastatinicus]|uniref:hypothetical protein n=1 Tax=Streptomyces himastatinicus TaxID=998084 RepID=UPI0001B4B219
MAATALAAFCAVPGFLVVAVPEGFFFAGGVFAGGVFAPADFAPVGFDAPVFPFAALFVLAALFVGALFVLFVPFMPFVPVAPFPGALLADPLFVGVLFNVRRISHPAMLTTGTYLPPRSSPPSDPACPSPYGVSLWPSAIPGR